MVFGKRQLLLATLVFALGIAIYLNWQFAKGTEDLTLETDANTGKNYGEAEFVYTEEEPNEMVMVNETSEDYFIEARLTKQQNRDNAVETLQDILKDSNITEEEKTNAISAAANLADAIDAEGTIESLVKAKGFEDCVVYIDGDKASIVVKTEGLLKSEAAQIKDIIINEANIPAENIYVIPAK